MPDPVNIQDGFTQEKIEIPEEIFYTIEEGDTLWAIAKNFMEMEVNIGIL